MSRPERIIELSPDLPDLPADDSGDIEYPPDLEVMKAKISRRIEILFEFKDYLGEKNSSIKASDISKLIGETLEEMELFLKTRGGDAITEIPWLRRAKEDLKNGYFNYENYNLDNPNDLIVVRKDLFLFLQNLKLSWKNISTK